MWSIIIVIIHVVLMGTSFISIEIFIWNSFCIHKRKKYIIWMIFFGFSTKTQILPIGSWNRRLTYYYQICLEGLPPPRSIPACPKLGPCIFSGCVMLTYCYLFFMCTRKDIETSNWKPESTAFGQNYRYELVL